MIKIMKYWAKPLGRLGRKGQKPRCRHGNGQVPLDPVSSSREVLRVTGSIRESLSSIGGQQGKCILNGIWGQ